MLLLLLRHVALEGLVIGTQQVTINVFDYLGYFFGLGVAQRHATGGVVNEIRVRVLSITVAEINNLLERSDRSKSAEEDLKNRRPRHQ